MESVARFRLTVTTTTSSSSSAKSKTTTSNEVISHPTVISPRNNTTNCATISNNDPTSIQDDLVESENKNNQSQTSLLHHEAMYENNSSPPRIPQQHRFVRSNRSSSSMVSGSSEERFYPRRNERLVEARHTDDNDISPRTDGSDTFVVVSNHHPSTTTTIFPNNNYTNTTTSTQDTSPKVSRREDPNSTTTNHDENEEISSTNVPHGTIQKIDAQSVQRIVAGQAVTDLASAVKELVDNALDAASPTINVRLFNRGINIIEVTDDGIGVPVESRKFLATPHATSKIRKFEDIYHCPDDSDDDDDEDDDDNDNDDDENDNGAAADDDDEDDDDELPSSSLATLGFRGEALFCLANLSGNLMISTRTANEELAEQMEFRKDGSLNTAAGITYVPRKVGTSVAIVRLFESIPVRRKDMIRRIRYQRAKLIEMMEGYAIFSTGVQIHVMDMVENPNDPTCHDSKSLLQTTTNNRTLQETVSSILGSKFLQTLSQIEIDLTDIVSTNPTASGDPENQRQSKRAKKNKYKYKIHGLISKASVTTTTKGVRHAQFFAINRRPVDLPKVVRLINETWRLFLASNNTNSMSSAPSCVIQFTIPNNAYDINLAPDKRQVLFTNEAEIYKALRDGLLQLWKSQTEGQFAVNNPKGLELIESRRSNDMKGYLQGKSTTDDQALDVNDDERINADVDNPKIDLLFDQNLVENTIATTTNENIVDELDQEEFIASRRYGFSDDPTLATNREMEDRIKLKEYLLTKPKQQQDDERQVTAEENMEIEQIMTPPTPLSEGADSMSVPADAHASSPKRKLITPSPAQVPLAISPSNAGSRTDEKLQFDGSADGDSINDKNSSSSSPFRQCNGQTEFRISISERRQWHDVTEKFNRSDDMHQTILRMITTNDKFEKVNGITKKSDPAIVLEGSKVSTNEGNEAIGLRRTDNKAVSSDATAEKSSDNTRKRKAFSGLEKFGYKVFKKGYDESILTERTMAPLIQTEQPQKLNFEKSVSKPIIQDKRFEEPLAKPVVPERSTKSFLPAGNDSPSERGAHDMTNLRGDSPLTCDTNPIVEAISQESAYVPKTTVWKSFTSTEDVVKAAIRERIAMRERRNKLRKNSLVDFQPMLHKKGDKGVDERSAVVTKPNEDDEEPSENKVAESITLSKTDFTEMKIIGQFNLGFILATTADGNLWILDQHACDEKYNFEKLCRETVIHEQRLIAPMPLELSPTEETCILDNMDIFEKNGFRFAYDPNKDVRHRLSLTALPHSGARDGRKAVQFGKDDVAALCEILNASNDDYAVSSGLGGGTGVDGSGSFGNNAVKRHAARSLSSSIHGGDDTDRLVARLPKAIAMFASRACRGSIMIGKALSEPEMDRVVKHLAEIENPWNCPHGRPTMRHVADLKPSLDKDEKNAAAYIAGPTLSILSQEEEGDSC